MDAVVDGEGEGDSDSDSDGEGDGDGDDDTGAGVGDGDGETVGDCSHTRPITITSAPQANTSDCDPSSTGVAYTLDGLAFAYVHATLPVAPLTATRSAPQVEYSVPSAPMDGVLQLAPGPM